MLEAVRLTWEGVGERSQTAPQPGEAGGEGPGPETGTGLGGGFSTCSRRRGGWLCVCWGLGGESEGPLSDGSCFLRVRGSDKGRGHVRSRRFRAEGARRSQASAPHCAPFPLQPQEQRE